MAVMLPNNKVSACGRQAACPRITAKRNVEAQEELIAVRGHLLPQEQSVVIGRSYEVVNR